MIVHNIVHDCALAIPHTVFGLKVQSRSCTIQLFGRLKSFRYLTIHISRSIGTHSMLLATLSLVFQLREEQLIGCQFWIGVNNIDKILGIVPKREFSVVYQNAKNVVKMLVFLLLQMKQNVNTGTGCGVYLV